jgi:hypothetical protein
VGAQGHANAYTSQTAAVRVFRDGGKGCRHGLIVGQVRRFGMRPWDGAVSIYGSHDGVAAASSAATWFKTSHAQEQRCQRVDRRAKDGLITRRRRFLRQSQTLLVTYLCGR